MRIEPQSRNSTQPLVSHDRNGEKLLTKLNNMNSVVDGGRPNPRHPRSYLTTWSGRLT